MAKIKGEINFLYVWKKINGQITDEEEEILNNWRNESEDNERTFQMFKYFYENRKSIHSRPVSVAPSYEQVLEKVRRRKRKKVVLWISTSAAAVLIIVFAVVALFPFRNSERLNQDNYTEINILPGQKQAVLVLNDGSMRELNNKTNVEIEEETAVIKGTGKSLVYESSQSGKEKLQYNTLMVPRGAEFFVTLSDSTKVWLNSETTLRYPVSFSGNFREVELIGEAYFEVTKDAKRPFRVISNDHIIQVLGTAFNLSSFKNQANIFTTLVHGKVVIKDVKDPDFSLELDPGQQSVYNKRSKSAYQHDVDVSLYTAWKDGTFKFKNEPLDKIMETLSRWYAVDVKFESEITKGVKFTGVLKRYQNFEDIIPILESTNDLKIFAYENEIIVK